MTKTFPEVISGIRTAKKGVEVREDIAPKALPVPGTVLIKNAPKPLAL